jgi:hypothetical protein
MTKEADGFGKHSGWEFPEMNNLSEFGENDSSISSDSNEFEPMNHSESELRDNDPLSRPKNSPHLAENELALQKREDELKAKNQLLDHLLTKLHDPLLFVDDQLINIMQDLIKKLVIKIVHKEINTDPEVLLKMIDSMKKLIIDQHGIVNVYLSEDDFKLIKTNPDDKNQVIQVNNNLKNGDIIIKTNDTEIRAILNDQVDLLMGTLHD